MKRGGPPAFLDPSGGQSGSHHAVKLALSPPQALLWLALRVRVTNVHCSHTKVTLIILERHPTSED
jgi:hypothetical protein